jgi:phenylalanyl-tRNA synthetase beta chain
MEEYVPGGAGMDGVPERMVMSGSNIEAVKEIGDGSVENVVLGRLTDVRPHPDSDHLVICAVEAGADAPLQIVTGAPNVKAGDFVPVALHGAVLPGGIRIKKGKLRGEASEGMLCSAQELGFDDKVVPLACKDGIWILPEEVRTDALLGKDIFEALGLARAQVIDFEITPNRPDCLAVYGLAAEYAAVYDLPLDPVAVLEPDAAGAGYPANKQASDYIKVEIAKPEHCYRYIARVAENVVIKESPWWLQKKLMLAGMRPINNIVDITNYVMLELGHPIHAFDIRQIEGGRIVVDTANAGEAFTTLDGTGRTLFEDTLLIKDGRRGVAVAGVMGGLNSEITDDTRTILIEAASFSPDSVRRTSKKLGIRTEASARYEKGVPAELSKTASDRVCQLIALTGAGTVLAGSADCYPVPQKQGRIPVRVARVNALLGTALSADEMISILKRLGIGAAAEGADSDGVLIVTPPTHRLDLIEEVDVVEEVGRIYGYDRLEMAIHADNAEAGVSKSWALRGTLRETLTGFGISEIQTYSFVSPSGVALIGAEDDAGKTAFVKLLNPLGEENSVMRTTLLPGLIEALARNYKRSAKSCRLFEIGNTFKGISNKEGLPTEALSLCAGVYGEGADFFFLKGCLEKVFDKFGLGPPVFEEAADIATFHPGRCARVYLRDASARQGKTEPTDCVESPSLRGAQRRGNPRKPGLQDVPMDCLASLAKTEAFSHSLLPPIVLGVVGELHPDVLDRFGIGERVCCLELDFDKLASAADTNRAYTQLPKYPAVLRDIALLVKDEMPVGQLLEIIRLRGGRILEAAELFDVYRGKQVPDGMKSIAFGLTFRDREKTLTDEDAQRAMAKILKGLADEAGATLRDN